MLLVNEDTIVAVALKQARMFQWDDEDRHLDQIAYLINSAEDPVNAAKKLARKCGRKLASEFLDADIVEAGARGRFRP